MNLLKKPYVYFIVFGVAGILWIIGLIIGGAILNTVNLFNNPATTDHFIIAWAILWAIALIAGSGAVSVGIYEQK